MTIGNNGKLIFDNKNEKTNVLKDTFKLNYDQIEYLEDNKINITKYQNFGSVILGDYNVPYVLALCNDLIINLKDDDNNLITINELENFIDDKKYSSLIDYINFKKFLIQDDYFLFQETGKFSLFVESNDNSLNQFNICKDESNNLMLKNTKSLDSEINEIGFKSLIELIYFVKNNKNELEELMKDFDNDLHFTKKVISKSSNSFNFLTFRDIDITKEINDNTFDTVLISYYHTTRNILYFDIKDYINKNEIYDFDLIKDKLNQIEEIENKYKLFQNNFESFFNEKLSNVVKETIQIFKQDFDELHNEFIM